MKEFEELVNNLLNIQNECYVHTSIQKKFKYLLDIENLEFEK